MSLVTASSLAVTLDAVNDALFYRRKLIKAERTEAAEWIVGRIGAPGSYSGLPAPTETDFREGATLFTGNVLSTHAGTAHVLGEEACRALLLLSPPTAAMAKALHQATQGMVNKLQDMETRGHSTGMYCCGTCSVAYWRHLAAGGLGDQERRLASGMAEMKRRRAGEGQWRFFPYYYALLALSEVDLPEAVEELRYAAPRAERLLTRSARPGPYAERRRDLLARVLEKV
jgi:hypothetical protein